MELPDIDPTKLSPEEAETTYLENRPRVTGQSTIGLSPKMYMASLISALPGLIVLIVGAITDDDTLITVGCSLLGGGVASGAAAYRASPGVVADHVIIEE